MIHKRRFQHYKRFRHHSLFGFLVSPSLLSSLLSPSSSSSSVLLSTARPTSPASDQTKGGGRSGVQRTPRFGAESERFDLTKIQLSSKIESKRICQEQPISWAVWSHLLVMGSVFHVPANTRKQPEDRWTVRAVFDHKSQQAHHHGGRPNSRVF